MKEMIPSTTKASSTLLRPSGGDPQQKGRKVTKAHLAALGQGTFY